MMMKKKTVEKQKKVTVWFKSRTSDMKIDTFEEWLRSRHYDFFHGADDDMPDAYEEWTTNMEYEDWIKRGDEYGEYVKSKITK